MLRKLAFILAVAAGATLPFASSAPAAIADGALAGRTSLIDNSLIDKVQYEYGGHNYCYSDTGWKGPGWYWCGSEQTYGVGWGGAYGWRGWTTPAVGLASASDATAAPGSVTTAPPVDATAAPGSVTTAPPVDATAAARGAATAGAARASAITAAVVAAAAELAEAEGAGGRRSDVRLKHDLVLLGRLDDGLGYYRFTYNGGHTSYVGVMAQEVQNVMPDAVTRDTDGYLRVSYDKLGLPFETYDQWLATGALLPVPKMVAH